MSKLMAPCIFAEKCPRGEKCIHSKIHKEDFYCKMGNNKSNTFNYFECPKCKEYTGIKHIEENFLSEKEMSI